jgi:hypothetical protein
MCGNQGGTQPIGAVGTWHPQQTPVAPCSCRWVDGVMRPGACTQPAPIPVAATAAASCEEGHLLLCAFK